MHFYQFLERLANTSVDHDLSTGEPLLIPELHEILREATRELADDDSRHLVLSSYEQLDGLSVFRDEFATLLGERYGRQVPRAEVLAIPGVQAGLRYVHHLLRQRNQRALHPVGVEFPGCVDPTGPLQPAVGAYTTVPVDDGVCRTVIDISEIEDWTDIGAVILSNPHSPTGRSWQLAELEQLATVASDNNALFVLDETYAPPFAPITNSAGALLDAPNVLHLFSMSKLGLAGERTGLAVGDPNVLRDLSRLQRSFVIQPPKAGQFLALRLLHAFQSRPELPARVLSAYRDRWERCRQLLADLAIPGLRIGQWEGGLFLWLEWEGPPDDGEVVESLLAQGIAVMPGSALAIAPDHPSMAGLSALRIGLGAPREELERTLLALGAVLSRAGRQRVNEIPNPRGA